MKTAGYDALMGEVRLGDFGDPHGTSMGWLFTLAEVAYVEFGEVLPEFRPSPALAFGDRPEWDDEPDQCTVFDLIDAGTVGEDDVRDVYTVLSRYNAWVRLAGRDY
jgi:hypothetical protein